MDIQDRRKFLIRLSVAGQKKLDVVMPFYVEWVGKWMNAIAHNDRAILVSSIKQLAEITQQAVLAAQSCLIFLKREYDDGVMPVFIYRTLTLCLHRVRSIVQSEKVNMTLIFAQPGAKEG